MYPIGPFFFRSVGEKHVFFTSLILRVYSWQTVLIVSIKFIFSWWCITWLESNLFRNCELWNFLKTDQFTHTDNLVPRAFPSKNGWGRDAGMPGCRDAGPTHFLREKPWGRGWHTDFFHRKLNCWRCMHVEFVRRPGQLDSVHMIFLDVEKQCE